MQKGPHSWMLVVRGGEDALRNLKCGAWFNRVLCCLLSIKGSELVESESIMFNFVGLETFSGGHKNDINLPLQQKSHCLNEIKKICAKACTSWQNSRKF